MTGAGGTVSAFGFSHPPEPPGVKVIKRSPAHPLEWHREKCPAPKGNCMGCAPAPKQSQ